jgi:hypothetical protein
VKRGQDRSILDDAVQKSASRKEGHFAPGTRGGKFQGGKSRERGIHRICNYFKGVEIMEEKDSISRQLKEAEQKIRILYEITRLVASFHSVQDVLDAIVELLAREFRLDACSIRLLDSDGNLRI